MLTSKAQFEPTTHKGEAVIFIRFDYDAALMVKVKKLACVGRERSSQFANRMA